MPYQENKPEATDQLNNSQDDIQKNFESIKQAFDINHVTFDIGDHGKHKYVILPEQVADPDPGADEAAIFSRLSTVTGNTGIFWQKEEAVGPVPGDVIEMTASKITGVSGSKKGFTILPSGLKINFGQGSIPGGTQGVANVFESNFADVDYSVTITPTTTNGGIGDDYILIARNMTANGFTASRAVAGHIGTATTFTYIAIGI